MSSAIDPANPTEGTATTESVRANFQAAKDEIEALQAGIDSWHAAYPVGAIYISTLTTNPNTLLGFGTWSAFGEGRVLVSLDSGIGAFDTIEETGGEINHTLTTGEIPSHNHTQNAHTHTQNAHTHTQNSHNHTQNAHSHIVPDKSASGSGSSLNTQNSVPASTISTATTTATNNAATATNQDATATNQDTTATNNAAGGGGSHNNLQPYIVVKMWKRTA